MSAAVLSGDRWQCHTCYVCLLDLQNACLYVRLADPRAMLVWSFFSNKWGESLVLPTNDSKLDIGTKIYYGLNELCILNFGENSVAEAQCSPLTNDMSRLIDGTLERDIRIGKAIIASSIGMSVLLVIVLIYGSIECLPHRLSNLKRHLLFVAMAALDCKCAKTGVSLLLSYSCLRHHGSIHRIATTESPRRNWVSYSWSNRLSKANHFPLKVAAIRLALVL